MVTPGWRDWGHTIRRPRPALVPLMSDERWLHELSGLTAGDVRLRVDRSHGRTVGWPAPSPQGRGVLIERRGSLLFTHFGLSGPVAMDVSRAVTGGEEPARCCSVS